MSNERNSSCRSRLWSLADSAREATQDIRRHCYNFCTRALSRRIGDLLDRLELATFLTDWNSLSQTFISGCCLRFQFWDMWPHVLLGLAAVHEDEARQAAAKAVRAWQVVEESGTELAQHPLACKFLQNGSPLRPEVHSLANGVHSLSDLSALKKAVAAFPFIVVAERSIEAKHALAKQGLRMNTNPSPPSVSMSLRFSEIEVAMCEESDFLPSLAVHFEK
eukprot:5176483-Amphidinium_carterae.1